ncbi:MAG TPA: ATP-binding protein [Thermoanaerobaculia bacterium]|nr:ATP-binding protein [Thermoanaerobaculia bacterium]
MSRAAAAGLALAALAAAAVLLRLWLERRFAGRLAPLAAEARRLAEESDRQAAAARAERDLLGSILAAMADGVLVVGADGRALLANAAFRRLFAVHGEVAGRALLELVRQPELAGLVASTLATGAPQQGELVLRGPERRTFALAGAPLRDGAGADGGAVLVARETTDATRLAETRRDFVANVSHELKTPLSAIRGFAETLRDGALDEPETARRFTGRILEQSRRLEALLADLLTLSRLESVGPPVEAEAVDLEALARGALELVARRAEERGVRLELEAAPLPPVPGDADALERLLCNLLDNAIKYNRPDGSVTLALSRDGERAVVEVRDTGIGIPPEAVPRLFERFYRVDKGRAREEGGTGLGLAIVKHVAQSHGGQVEVESRPGQGSTFRVRLPLQA